MSEARPAEDPRDGDEHLRALMRRYQQGDIDAFEELYGRTVGMVRGYLGALSRDRARAADLTQDAYLQLHRSRNTYDPAHPLRPWMLAIARHTWLTDLRWRKRRQSKEVGGLDGLPELPVPPEVDGFVAADVLARALARLPADRREALVLHHLYGLSFREVGGVVGVSEGGARVRASRAMGELRALLGPRGDRG